MPEIRMYVPRAVVFLTVTLMLALPAPSAAQSAPDLSKYQEMEIAAPDFSLRGLDGETYTMSDFRGKVVAQLFGADLSDRLAHAQTVRIGE